jgi:hypothetical protein
MATESPLLHDGGQCLLSTASDFRNSALTGTTLAGPSGSGQFLAVILSSTVDRTVTLPSSGVSAAGLGIYGIVQNKPRGGEAADVGFLGVSKCVAGLAITRGVPLMASATAGGTLVPFSTTATGPGGVACGVALESAAIGQVFTANIFGIMSGLLRSTA